MAKIERYDGNLKAFASEAQGLERTLFGNESGTQSDALTDNINALFRRGWGGLVAGRKPPREWFNSTHWVATQLSAYLHQVGVPEWNDTQEYYAGAVTNHGGHLWRLPETFAGASVGDEPGVAEWVLQNSIDVDGVKNLATAPRSSEVTVRTIGFYEGGLTGGQLFRWNPTADKADHDGITTIDPVRCAAWDGTHSDLSTLFTAGTGDGCFVVVNGLPTAVREIDVFATGAVGNASNDDYTPLSQALTVCRNKGAALADHLGGRFRLVSAGLVYSTAGLGAAQGLTFYGAGSEKTELINNTTGEYALFVSAGNALADFNYGTKISGVKFTGAGGGGLAYQGCWGANFKDLKFEGLGGSAIRPVNVVSDGDSSVQVNIERVFCYNCAGPAYDSNGSTGGLTLHTFSDFFSQACGGADANIVIDGMIHCEFENTTTVQNAADAGYNADQFGVHIKATNIQPRGILIDGGEIGNDAKTGIYVDSISQLTLKRFRLVRRAGENTFTTGIEFADGASLHSGVTIEPLVLDIDDATPVFTFLKLGTGVREDLKVRSPAATAFAAGNVYVTYGTGVAEKGVFVEDLNGRALTSRSEKVRSETIATAGTTNLPAGEGTVHRAVLGATGAHTINLPGGAEGQTLTLILFNASGGAVTVTVGNVAALSGYTDPANGDAAVCEFIYDPLSAIWRQKGAWS